MKLASLLGVGAILTLSACQSYVNSPRVAAARAESARAFSDPLIARAYHAKPAMQFPARIAIAPMNDGAQTAIRNLDANGSIESLKRLPNVAATMPLSSLLLADGQTSSPGEKTWNRTDLVLREAAARLHADAVLMIKVDTHISDGTVFAPLTLASLGLFPNNRAAVIATTLAALVDTRTGYVYGTLERSAGRTCYTMSWDSLTRDRTIDHASSDSTRKLLADVPDFWRGVVQAQRR